MTFATTVSTSGVQCGSPIKLPTWDHISQMCLNTRDLREKWSFFKAGRESAYKKLPMAPDHANLALAPLRNPTSGKRAAFPPKDLVFGAVSSVLRYNCFSRLISVIFNKIFGIPPLRYSGDFRDLAPARLCEKALLTFGTFCETIGIRLKSDQDRPLGPSNLSRPSGGISKTIE